MDLLLQFLFSISILLTLAYISSNIACMFGLPGLVGEIIVGIAIANFVIGDWSPMSMLNIIMPTEDSIGNTLYSTIHLTAELGVIFLLFTVGLDTNVMDLIKSGKTAFTTAVLGVIFPFIVGFILMVACDGSINHALFLAAAMVSTSVGITAHTIKNMGLIDTYEARIIISAAVIDDILGMIVLAIVKGMTQTSISIQNIIFITIQASVFVLIIVAICKYAIPKLNSTKFEFIKLFSSKLTFISTNKLIFAIMICLIMSAFAEYIGLAAIIGSFFAGMLFSDCASRWNLKQEVEPITTLFISFFFVDVGLQVDASSLMDIHILALSAAVIALALATKFIGCGIGAKIGDKYIKKSSMEIIGVGMMPRGEVGIIIASIGLVSGVMSVDLYSVVVIMSVATTII